MTPIRSVFVVTGATAGIGLAITMRLIAASYRVVAVGRNETVLAALREKFGSAVDAVKLELGDLAAVGEFADEVAASYPSLGGLVHCAATIVHREIAETTVDDVDHIMAVNFRAPFFLTGRLSEPLAAGRGQIVFINSTAALLPASGRAAYSASKSALRALADAARVELNARGIRVASIYPGRTEKVGADVLLAGSSKQPSESALLQPDVIAGAVMNIITAPAHAEIMDVTLRPSAKSY